MPPFFFSCTTINAEIAEIAESVCPSTAPHARRLARPRRLRHEEARLERGRDLLEVFVRRHETASTLITTNRPTQDWGIFLGDVSAATAILDRFLAHATIVQVTGKSYRLTREFF